MPNNPSTCEKCFEGAINSWRSPRPTKKFLGLTVDEFEAKYQDCFEVRDEIKDLEKKLSGARVSRDKLDGEGQDLLGRFVNAIKADENEGEDSELLEAMGYVIKSRRKSGLHRVSPESNTTPMPKAA